MILFVTMRPDTLEIQRRLSNFEELRIDARHFPLARRHFPQIFLTMAGVGALRRFLSLFTGIFRLRREVRLLGPSDILFVSALDCLFVTLLARTLSGNRSKLICEIMDVHYLLLMPNVYRPFLRAIERWALARTDLLIVPTQGNIDRYYRPIAGYRGAAAVVHNKLPSRELRTVPPAMPFDGCWTIGWFGSLRCERSLEILCHTAAVLGDKVQILIAGTCKLPHERFEAAIKPHSNMVYLGDFDAPADAARLYAQVHFAYALHFEPPVKCTWMLAVRILEGGAYGRPAIVPAASDMGRFVAEHGTGWAIEEPCEDDLPRFLKSLTADEYAQVAERVSAQKSLYVGEDHLAAALAAVSGKPSGHHL